MVELAVQSFEPVFDHNPFVTMDMAQKHPVDAAKVFNALRKVTDNAPSSMAATNTLPQASLSQLTNQFDVSRIPLIRLRQMMRDPMIAFALFFIKAQMLRARWSIESSDAQVAGFIDNALREIYPSLVAQFLMKLVFGYQALIKRFELKDSLDWTYVDPTDEVNPEKPVWDQGNIQALVWKPFANLPAEAVDPIWTPQGDFNGINYKPALVQTAGGAGSGTEQNYDVLHSLWFTNEKETVNGSLWGYPRIGYAYRFWWSFWFNWGLADRHFEKDADPPAVVYYPSNKPDLVDPVSGASISRRQMALNIGDRARSGSTIALPSDPVISDDGSAKNIREWEITFPKGGDNFEVFKERFDQLGMMILRSCMVPEEAFQAKGGTAGYNSTGQLQDAFAASQIVLMQEFDFDLNRYVIPQLVMANFQDRIDQGVKATKVTRGFDSNDVELQKAIITSMANSDASQLELDVPSMLDAVGLPHLSPAAIAKKNAELAGQAQQTTPTPVAPQPGQAGVTQTGLYVNPREQIKLADDNAESVFFADLIQIAALRDALVMADARGLRTIWQNALSYDFAVAGNLVHDYKDDLKLDENFLDRFFRRVSNRAHDTVFQTRRALSTIMRRASTIEFEQAGLTEFSWDPNNSEAASKFLQERAAEMVEGISNTTRDQVKVYLADLVKRKVPPEQMPQLLRAHFQMFSSWRADQIVRTEVSRAYNMATLLAAQDAGVKQVQAIDAQLGPERSDPKCIDRNGRVFTVEQAFAEQEEEHPNGTLQWRILRKPVTVKRLPVPKGKPAGVLASFEEDDDQVVVTFSEALNERQRNNYLIAVVDRINMQAQLDEIEEAA